MLAFDLLMVDGESLINESLRERRRRLALALPNLRPGYLEIAHSVEMTAPAAGPDAAPAEAGSAAADPAVSEAEVGALKL